MTSLLVRFLVVACAGIVDPLYAGTIFGLVDTGELYESSDGGSTWSVRSTLPISDAVAIGAAKTTSDLYLATRSGMTYHSSDAGMSWAAVGASAASDVCAMEIRPSGNLLHLSEAGILWRSDDNGVTFAPLATMTASNFVDLDDGGSEDLFALTETGEVWRSTDAGANWVIVGALPTSSAVAIHTMMSDLFVLTATGDVARSSDHGTTWTFVGTISQVHMTALTLDDTGLIIASREGLVASSSDGMDWNWMGSINQVSVVALGNDTPRVTGLGPDEFRAPHSLSLRALWPNPRGSTRATNVVFALSHASRIGMDMIDARGRMVFSRASETFSEGEHHVLWHVDTLASGVYFLRLKSDTGAFGIRKITVLR